MKKTTRAVAPFRTSDEHLLAEFDWLDSALLALVRSSHDGAQRDGHGWFVSTEEAESLLTRDATVVPNEKIRGSLQRKRRQIVKRRNASVAQGVHLTLPHLGRLFSIGAAEELLLIACLAAAREDKYGKVFGYLHDDLTRRQPSIQLIDQLSRLEESSPSTGSIGTSIADSELPLFRWDLVCSDPASSLGRVARGWWIDQRIAAYLLEQDQIDASLRSALCVPGVVPEGPVGGTEVEREIQNFVADRPGALVVQFHGPGASDGETIARRVCQALELQLIHVNLDLLLETSPVSVAAVTAAARTLYREALLQHAAVYISGFERLVHESRNGAHLRAFEDVAREVPWLTFVEGASLWLPGLATMGFSFLPCYLEASSFETRRRMWALHLGERTEPDHLNMLAARYRFSSRHIRRAVELATTHAAGRGDVEPAHADLRWACRLQSTPDLQGLARTIAPRRQWADLVLPEDVLVQLQDICAQARHRSRVLHEWGFDRLLSSGKGLYTLFVGPSGTGKTLAAEVLAGALDVDLIAVDLSSVVSKYIGETESNLERVFQATERADAILFFDEADAIFGKRSEIKDAHDRYANIEVAFLLQRLEAYEGFVILASNLASNMDAAFTRRMQFMVEFPFPDESARLGIWRRHLPEEMPVSSDIDFAWLSRELKVAGGNIRNIVLNAAFMAADGGHELRMSDLRRAAQREYARLGKVHRFQDTARATEACG